MVTLVNEMPPALYLHRPVQPFHYIHILFVIEMVCILSFVPIMDETIVSLGIEIHYILPATTALCLCCFLVPPPINDPSPLYNTKQASNHRRRSFDYWRRELFCMGCVFRRDVMCRFCVVSCMFTTTTKTVQRDDDNDDYNKSLFLSYYCRV
mmetsp:Transcript_41112/g.44585  ORF Transcript_41112/g.44585 Transcript_41112/m.44585 type:complete len:152 (-) Transcript_41112:60-515(-)